MSRVGSKPIQFESQVKIKIEGNIVMVEGPEGKINLEIPKELKLNIAGNNLTVEKIDHEGKSNIQGLYRSLFRNAISGVTKKWSKTLELIGVGFRAETNGGELTLNLGFSHPVKIKAPEGITFKVEENKITVIGVDKYLVGEVAASIRRIKKPEPYKGKGIRYQGEHIRKKLGKAAKTVGATTGGK